MYLMFVLLCSKIQNVKGSIRISKSLFILSPMFLDLLKIMLVFMCRLQCSRTLKLAIQQKTLTKLPTCFNSKSIIHKAKIKVN